MWKELKFSDFSSEQKSVAEQEQEEMQNGYLIYTEKLLSEKF